MSSNDPLIGKQLGDYKILGLLGHGGMARVYRGYDDKLERYAAVKVFDSYSIAQDELDEYRARFQREARAIARLYHPQIVGVYQFGQMDSLHYMAMMFIEGRDLRHILKEHASHNTRMSFIDILRIITDVASALDYAHREGVIHRDVKPSNIMVTANGHAVLTDFGLALNVPEGTIGTTFGSVHYIAPEQAVSSAQAVPQSDLYSLGVVLYEMLTGRVPFDDASAMSVALKHLSDTPPPPSQINPEITPEIEVLVMKALDKEPGKRFQTGSEMVRALEIGFGMTDEDELTRKLMALPDWALQPELSLFKSNSAVPEKHTAQATPSPSAASAGKTLSPLITNQDHDKTVSEKSAPVGRSQVRRTASLRFSSVHWRMTGAAAFVVVVATLAGFALLNTGQEYLMPAPTVTLAAAAATNSPARLSAIPSPTEQITITPVNPASATAEDAETPATDRTSQAFAAPTTAAAPLTTLRASAAVAAAHETAVIETRQPTQSPTEPPETASAAANTAQIELIYDVRSLVLLNRSQTKVNVANVSFVQTTPAGRQLTFRANTWEGGSAPPDALPPGGCFMVWVNQVADMPQPDYCQTRHAFFLAGQARWFWISPDPAAVFEVRREGAVVAECSIGTGRCLVDLDTKESR